MNKIAAILTAALVGAPLALAAPAQAAVFEVCPSGESGVLNGVTTCDFADDMRGSWEVSPRIVVTAYSPAMQRYYTMYCTANQTITLSGGLTRFGVLCTGGNTDDAELVFW